MDTIRHLLESKTASLATVTPGATIRTALQVMAEREVGAVLVVDDGRLVGLMSERDYARKVALRGRASHEMTVREIMTDRLVCVTPRHGIRQCLALMSDKHIRHLPVLDDDGRLVGIVSIGDLVKAVISDQQFVIRQLEAYITG